jgi:hypothetical protein
LWKEESVRRSKLRLRIDDLIAARISVQPRAGYITIVWGN